MNTIFTVPEGQSADCCTVKSCQADISNKPYVCIVMTTKGGKSTASKLIKMCAKHWRHTRDKADVFVNNVPHSFVTTEAHHNCAICDREIYLIYHPAVHTRYRWDKKPRQFCSDHCRDKYYYLLKATARACEWCEDHFQPQRGSSRFCSTRCRMASHRAGKKAENKA